MTNLEPFAPITPRESAVDACARALRGAILRGTLAPGARLPPERRLAEKFGVNRVTLRGALAKLAAAKLLSVRQGSGYLVRDYRREGGPELLPGLAELARERGDFTQVVADLLLVRRQLARAVLQRLAQSRDHGAGIRAAIDRFAELVAAGADADRIAEADIDVAAAVLAATGSAVLGLCLNPITQVLTQLPALRRAMFAEPEQNLAGYRLLLAWLDDRRAEAVDAFVRELEERDARTLARLRKGST